MTFSPSRAFFWLFWLFSLYEYSALGAVIQLEDGLALPLNLTGHSYLGKGIGESRCQRSKDWVAPGFDGEDCFRVIELFQDVEKDQGRSKFEFIAPTKPPAHRSLRPQATPRNYTYGTCVLEIVMMADPILEGVEGRDVRPDAYTETDVATYPDFYKAAEELADTCFRNFEIPGFITTGSKLSIGVFFWAVGSALDKKVAEYDPSPPPASSSAGPEPSAAPAVVTS